MIRARGHINHDHTAGVAGKLEFAERGGILGRLPKEMEKAETMVSAFPFGLENRRDARRRHDNACAAVLRPDEADDGGIDDDRLTPADALDFRTGFECDDINGTQLSLAHGK